MIQVGDDQQVKYCFGVGNLGTICHHKVSSLSTLLKVRTSTWEIPHRIDKEDSIYKEKEKSMGKHQKKQDSHLKIDKTFSEKFIDPKQRSKNVTEEIKSKRTQDVIKNKIEEEKFQTEKIHENKNLIVVKTGGNKQQLTKRKCHINKPKTTVDNKTKSFKTKENPTVPICHKKCVNGMEMKRVRIDISKNYENLII